MTLDPGLLPRYVLMNIYLLALATFITWNNIINKNKFNSKEALSILNNRIIYFYLGYLIFSLISLSYSRNTADGWFEFYSAVLGFLLIILLLLFFHHSIEKKNEIIQEIVRSISTLNFIISIIGLLQLIHIISSAEVTYESVHDINATFIHKNIFAEMLLVTMPFGIYSFLTYKKLWKFTGITGAILSIALIIITLTRAVWIAGTIAAILTSAIIIYTTIKGAGNKINFKPLLYIIAGTFIVSVLVFTRLNKENALRKQIASIAKFNYGSTKERLVLWKNSLKIFNENSIQGDGLGSWKIDILKYGNKGLKSEDNLTFYTRPHNDFIWVLSETGIIGFSFFIGIWISGFYYIFRKFRHALQTRASQVVDDSLQEPSSQEQNNNLNYVLTFALISYLVFSFFSFPKERIEHIAIISFILCLIIILQNGTQNTRHKIQDNINLKLKSLKSKIAITLTTSMLTLIILLLILSFNVGIKRTLSEMHTRNAFILRADHNRNEEIYELKKAENKYYTMDPVCTPLAWYKGEAEFELGNIDNAFTDFQSAYKINPYHIHVLNNLGTCYELKKDHQNAIKYYEAAISLSPKFEDALLNLAAVNYNSGNYDKAFLSINEIDTKTFKANYKPYLIAILKEEIRLLNDTISVPEIKKQIQDISASEGWFYDIYTKSKNNNRLFLKQLLLDAIFCLEITNKQFTFAQSSLLKKKYKL